MSSLYPCERRGSLLSLIQANEMSGLFGPREKKPAANLAASSFQ